MNLTISKLCAVFRQSIGGKPSVHFDPNGTREGAHIIADATFKHQVENIKNAARMGEMSIYVENAGRISVLELTGAGRLSNKTVIVTGSAQGFGKGIAEELYAEGANVVIADLNAELAAELADSLGARALAVKVDVTNEASVEGMINAAVQHFGGLDIFVNNAGVLKAGGLDEMDLSAFEFVNRVNYTAYFLCVKYASEIMRLQNSIDNEYFSDIIQINSKSGLAGSNKNFAYAGGKFGGIGLTQSFALELAPFCIKVNSICPGNFYEGPLWNDPDKGLFVQYLRAGKVPGAKTIDDVRKFYDAKVPLGRGCYPKDVARAILYCVEQEYETGQAIPVTGGQIMLK